MIRMSLSEITRAIDLFDAGMTPAEIGGELGYAPRTISRCLAQAGVLDDDRVRQRTAARPADYEPGAIPARLAAMMQEPVRTRRCHVDCSRALRDHLQDIIKAHQAGYGIRRIAKAIGVDRDQLHFALIDAGIETHRGSRGPIIDTDELMRWRQENMRRARLYEERSRFASGGRSSSDCLH